MKKKLKRWKFEHVWKSVNIWKNIEHLRKLKNVWKLQKCGKKNEMCKDNDDVWKTNFFKWENCDNNVWKMSRKKKEKVSTIKNVWTFVKKWWQLVKSSGKV